MEYFKDIEQVLTNYTKTGAFLTVSNGDKINTMTVSWGFAGMFLGKFCFVVGVRPQRYTKQFIDNTDSFTLSVPFEKLKDELITCGTKSGRDIKKDEVVKFIKAKAVDSYIVDGCDAYFECKIILKQDIIKDAMAKSLAETIYPNDDFHMLYFGEIVETY